MRVGLVSSQYNNTQAFGAGVPKSSGLEVLAKEASREYGTKPRKAPPKILKLVAKVIGNRKG